MDMARIETCIRPFLPPRPNGSRLTGSPLGEHGSPCERPTRGRPEIANENETDDGEERRRDEPWEVAAGQNRQDGVRNAVDHGRDAKEAGSAGRRPAASPQQLRVQTTSQNTLNETKKEDDHGARPSCSGKRWGK